MTTVVDRTGEAAWWCIHCDGVKYCNDQPACDCISPHRWMMQPLNAKARGLPYLGDRQPDQTTDSK